MAFFPSFPFAALARLSNQPRCGIIKEEGINCAKEACMGKWIGEMGGFVAVALVAALGVRFFCEMGWLKNRAAVRQSMRTALCVLCAGLCWMTLGGLYHHFFRSGGSAWDIAAVWGLNDFTMYLCFAACIAGTLLLDGAFRGAWRVVWLPFAFYLYTIPAVALAFCAASALAYWMFRGRGFTVPGLTVPWLTPACIVLGAFALFACL